MNYNRFVGLAHVMASCCAAIAAVGAAVGFHELSGSWLVACLLGAGTAVVLGLGWFALIGAAAHTRRVSNILLALVGGACLTAIALAVSGWSLATALGGVTAHRIHDAEQIALHDEALIAGFERVTKQRPLEDALSTASTVYAGYVTNEAARGGCGPKCLTYQSAADSIANVSAEVHGQVETAILKRQQAEEALTQARLGRDVEANLAFVASTVAHLNSVDLDAGSVGLVRYTYGADGVSNVATDELTQAIVAADAETPDPVAVPVYEKISKAEATLAYAHRVAGAWAAAIGIDCGPLLLLILVLAFWREPLLRNDPKLATTDDAIRDKEAAIRGDNVRPLR